jgi:hypothetical protein
VKVKRITKLVSDAREMLRMDRASFNNIGPSLVVIRQDDVTEFIRERTRLWRGSWVEAPLDEALELLAPGYKPPTRGKAPQPPQMDRMDGLSQVAQVLKFSLDTHKQYLPFLEGVQYSMVVNTIRALEDLMDQLGVPR